jgi:hypothetical protein
MLSGKQWEIAMTVNTDVVNSKAVAEQKALRDTFAAAALTGVITDLGVHTKPPPPGSGAAIRSAAKDQSALIAEAAYKIADAMLAKRG